MKKEREGGGILTMTIHLRLGDSAPLLINDNGDLINLGSMLSCDINLENCLSNINKISRISNQYQIIIGLKKFVNNVRNIFHHKIKINLVTDGFENTQYVLEHNKNIQNNIARMCVIFDKDIVKRYINSIYSMIDECNFDDILIGDNYGKFLKVQSLFVKSDILISYQRPFMMKNLLAFKHDIKPQLVFANDLESSMVTYINNKKIFVIDSFSYDIFYKYIIDIKNNRLFVRYIESDIVSKILSVIYNNKIVYSGKSYSEYLKICCQFNKLLLDNRKSFWRLLKYYKGVKYLLYNFNNLKSVNVTDEPFVDVDDLDMRYVEYVLNHKRKDRWYSSLYLAYKLTRRLKND